jgi:hypothetical protein
MHRLCVPLHISAAATGNGWLVVAAVVTAALGHARGLPPITFVSDGFCWSRNYAARPILTIHCAHIADKIWGARHGFDTGSRVAERGGKKKLALTESSGLPAEIEQNKEIQKSWAAVLAGAPFRHHDDIAR